MPLIKIHPSVYVKTVDSNLQIYCYFVLVRSGTIYRINHETTRLILWFNGHTENEIEVFYMKSWTICTYSVYFKWKTKLNCNRFVDPNTLISLWRKLSAYGRLPCQWLWSRESKLTVAHALEAMLSIWRTWRLICLQFIKAVSSRLQEEPSICRRWLIVCLMLGQRRRPNIKYAMSLRIVFTGFLLQLSGNSLY